MNCNELMMHLSLMNMLYTVYIKKPNVIVFQYGIVVRGPIYLVGAGFYRL
jgi:hypothetical protein